MNKAPAHPSILKTIEGREMAPFQSVAVAVCLAINMLDGFDVLAIAFTAPAISDDWALTPGALGVALSAGLLGMTLGSLLIAPLADRLGRRPIILACLVLMSLGMIATGFSRGVADLSVYRIITGLGIGGMLASLNTLVAEYSSATRRDLMVSLLQAGYPIGATVGGIIATFIIAHYGWRYVFIAGGSVSLIMIPAVLWRVPESLDFLVNSQQPDRLSRINSVLRKLNVPILDNLPDGNAGAAENTSARSQLLGRANRATTFSLWTAFFMVMFTFYFVLSWTPKLLVDSGLSKEIGISGGVIMNLGGILGIFLLGFVSAQLGLKRLLTIYMVATSVSMIAFGFVGTHLVTLTLTATVIGFFLFGSIVGLYVVTPKVYPSSVRTTGTGWAIGVGRLGAVLGPYIAGLMRDNTWSTTALFLFFSFPMLVACYALQRIKE